MSFPPPYRSYSFEEADSNNNNNNNSDPYMSPPVSPRSTTAGSPYAQLPAFDSPPRYSQRLRELVESRGHPMQLNLDRTQTQPASTRAAAVAVVAPVVVVEKPSEQEVAAVDYDEKEDYEPEQINLLTATDLEEGIDFDDAYNFDGRRCHGRSQSGGFMGWSWSGGRRSSRRHGSHRCSRGSNGSRVAKWQRRSSHDDRELSWLTFIGIAMFVFLLMTVCGVFVAWSAGGSIGATELTSGNRAYWVGSNNAASGAVVKANSKPQQVPSGGEIDIQQLGGHFVIDSYTAEVVEKTKGKEKKPKIRL